MGQMRKAERLVNSDTPTVQRKPGLRNWSHNLLWNDKLSFLMKRPDERYYRKTKESYHKHTGQYEKWLKTCNRIHSKLCFRPVIELTYQEMSAFELAQFLQT